MNLAEQTLSFDDLLNAVQESSRGRWFLGQYEQRIRATGTENILSSIAKLEHVISGMAGSGTDAALLSRAKSAIAAARKDIAALDQNHGQANLSNEARLFAKLADMARTSFTADGKINDNPVVNNGVVRALRLVDELDQAMAVAPNAAATYFAPHADVFESPVAKIEAPKTIAADIKATPKAEPKPEVERGAKLTIKRSGAAAQAIEPIVEITATPEAIAETPVQRVTQAIEMEPILASKPRVVIIRRQADEHVNVPMVADTPAEASTAA